MRLALLVLLLFSLAAGTASACDLAAPVRGPGQFFLYELETSKETIVEVRERWLGAGCELSNSVAFDGANLVWMEGPERSDRTQTLRYRGADGSARTLVTGILGHPELGVTSTHAYYVGGTRQAPVLVAVRLSDGQSETVPVTLSPNARLVGAVAAWFNNEGTQISAFDAANQRWLLRAATLQQLGVTGHDQGQLLAFDAEHVFFSSYSSTQHPTTFRFWTFGLATRALAEIDQIPDPYSAWIDQGTLYVSRFDSASQGHRLFSMLVEGGAPRDLGVLPHETGKRLIVANGQVLLASYARQDAHKHGPGATTEPGPSEPIVDAWPIPALPPVVGLVALALLAIRIRARP